MRTNVRMTKSNLNMFSIFFIFEKKFWKNFENSACDPTQDICQKSVDQSNLINFFKQRRERLNKGLWLWPFAIVSKAKTKKNWRSAKIVNRNWPLNLPGKTFSQLIRKTPGCVAGVRAIQLFTFPSLCQISDNLASSKTDLFLNKRPLGSSSSYWIQQNHFFNYQINKKSFKDI